MKMKTFITLLIVLLIFLWMGLYNTIINWAYLEQGKEYSAIVLLLVFGGFTILIMLMLIRELAGRIEAQKGPRKQET